MEESEKRIVEIMIPAIISELILDGEISESSSDDMVKKTVETYLRDKERFDSMNIAVTIGNEFEKSLENAIELQHNKVAIALAGICLEQITNEFYQKILLNKYGFSNKEYSSCMKCVSVKDKLTWMYKLITLKRIDDRIVNKVGKVCSARNNIVHYKPKIENMGEVGEETEDNTNCDLDVNELTILITELREIFFENTHEIFNEEKVAKEIFERVFSPNARK